MERDLVFSTRPSVPANHAKSIPRELPRDAFDRSPRFPIVGRESTSRFSPSNLGAEEAAGKC
jgi:hypothetical protein